VNESSKDRKPKLINESWGARNPTSPSESNDDRKPNVTSESILPSKPGRFNESGPFRNPLN